MFSVWQVHFNFLTSQFFELTGTFSSLDSALEHLKTGVNWYNDQRVDKDVWFAICIVLSLVSSEVNNNSVSVLLLQTDDAKIAVS